MNRSINLGGGSGIEYPPERVFAFSPYKCVVTGTAVAQAVVFTWTVNSITKTLTRYTGSDKKVTISLQKLFQSFFYNVETGIVPAVVSSTYANTASKLIDKVINVKIGTDPTGNDLIFDIMYGSLQQGETEATEETIYRFGSELPLTITQNIGSWISNTPATLYEASTYGKDIDIQVAITDNKMQPYLFRSGDPAVTVRTINVVDMSVCTESYYLRWIDRKTSSYKYYNFLLGRNTKAASNGATFNYNVLELSATNGLYKNSLQTLEKISTETITVVEPSADLLQQIHIQSIFDSPKVWLYMDNFWNGWK